MPFMNNIYLLPDSLNEQATKAKKQKKVAESFYFNNFAASL